MTIVFNFPQLRPRSHLKDKNKFKLVGSSIDDQLHFNGINDKNEISVDLKEFLAEFPHRLNHNAEMKKAKVSLVYVSLGTIFNTDVKIFNIIIKALNLVNSEMPIKAIIATGDACYEELKQQQLKQTSSNIFLLKTAPQIEILQRASLFITHNGMNSTSEAIYFGVPMICLPMALGTDQPLLAYRVADELGLGIRLSKRNLSEPLLRDAIVQVLSDEGFKERIEIFREISRKYDGVKNATALVENILKDNEACKVNEESEEKVLSNRRVYSLLFLSSLAALCLAKFYYRWPFFH
jgi:hypothetical protein